MRKIYSKDTSDSDALTAIQWLADYLSREEESLMSVDNSISINYWREAVRVISFERAIYVIMYSCGVNEDVYIASLNGLMELMAKYAAAINDD